MAFSEGHKLNFETLKAAKDNDDLCLLEVYERIGGAPVTIICATYKDDEGNINFVPLARMLDADPYATLVTTQDMVAKYWGERGRPFIYVEGSARQIPDGRASYHVAEMLLNWHLRDPDRVAALRKRFAEEVVTNLPTEWSLSALEIDTWVAHAEDKEMGSTTTTTTTTTQPFSSGLVNPFGQPISSGKNL